MSWSPKNPNLRYGVEVLGNLHTYVKTNADAAVTWANGNTAMTPYKRISRNARVSEQAPSLAVLMASQEPKFNEEFGGTDLTQEFLIETTVGATAPEGLMNDLNIRVAANWKLIETMTPEDWLAGMAGTLGGLVVELNQAVFAGHREPKTANGLYLQTALQSFTITYQQVN